MKFVVRFVYKSSNWRHIIDYFDIIAFNINFKLKEAIRIYTHGPMKIEIFRISSRRSMT